VITECVIPWQRGIVTIKLVAETNPAFAVLCPFSVLQIVTDGHIDVQCISFCEICWVVNMQLMISPVGPNDGKALASLYRWLSHDAGVARHGQVTIQTVNSQLGEMGAAVDVINAVFADASAAASIGSLLVAYRAWRDTRTQAPSFVIEKDGVTVVICHGSEQEISQILDSMLPGATGTDSLMGPGPDQEER
jgi:hypothetical protein